MNTTRVPTRTPPVVYPESDGKPLAENTKQLRWIVTFYGNLAAQYREVPDVFVGADQLWYPVEGELSTCTAPDTYVVFGRPKGHRSSWKQWEEADTPPTVVFEVLSPSNDGMEMADKLAFYDDHGCEEFYTYNPDTNRLAVYVRQGTVLRRQWRVEGFVSPRLGIRFDLSGPEMVVYRANGVLFRTFEDLDAALLREELLHQAEKSRADQQQQRADQQQQRADQQQQLIARLAELSRKARRGLATPEEVAELERLEGEASA